jgi:predicted dinucleotide-binding enzyme
MRIGILGSGGVAQTLGSGFLAKGHEVTIGTRDPKATLAKSAPDAMGTPPLSGWAKANPKAKVATMAEAAKNAEVVVFAIHGANVEEAVKAAGAQNLAGKLVLDTTNPLDFGANGAHKPASIPDSCMQVAQRAAPKAKFVKAWNCTPGHLMVNPKQGPGDQFICGDDAKAKEQAAKILKEFGWNVRDWAAKTNDWGWIIKAVGAK